MEEVMFSASAERYSGTVATVSADGSYAFIGLGSVVRANGQLHNLNTDCDVFLHSSDAGAALRVGQEVGFRVTPDNKRGGNALKAVEAVEIFVAEVIPHGEPAIPGFLMTQQTGGAVAVRYERDPKRHARMKHVPEEAVRKAGENHPLSSIQRQAAAETPEQKLELLRIFLEIFFPSMLGFNADFNCLTADDAALDRELAEAVQAQQAFGMVEQVAAMQEETARFKSMRSTLRLLFEEGLVRTDTIIPIKHLPDLFVACPVWYHWIGDSRLRLEAESSQEESDPRPHEAVKYFCDLFPDSIRWADTFQLFNRRVRTLAMYKGDMIPNTVSRRLTKAVQAFDYVVIATPYLDVAGMEWRDPAWMRSIDPYVLGFKKGIPFFFVLARFSDTGTFPLLLELVGDTMEFLKTNRPTLLGLDDGMSPYWYQGPNSAGCCTRLGTRLANHVDGMLAAFDAGNLFDWMRTKEVSVST